MDGVAIPIIASDNKAGRPYKYETHVLPRIQEVYDWLCEGATDYSICDNLDVCSQTWIDYKKTKVELIDVYTRVRTHRNKCVMNAHYEKALGIDRTVPKAFKIKEVQYDDKGRKIAEKEHLEYGEEHIYVPPDVNSADMYLRNNDPEYKSAKADASGVTLIQNNYQLPQLQQQLLDIDAELKRLEIIDTTMADTE